MNASTASLPHAAHIEHTDLRAISFHHVRFIGLELVDVDISGEIDGVRVNGVDIGPLVEAELDRRMPDRTKMRPTTVEGFQDAWATLERFWSETEARARALPAAVPQRVVVNPHRGGGEGARARGRSAAGSGARAGGGL